MHYLEQYEICGGVSMKRKSKATALRIYCAERTRAMRLVRMCASDTCTVLFMSIGDGENMEVQA